MAGQSIAKQWLKPRSQLFRRHHLTSLLIGGMVLLTGCAPQKPVYDFIPPENKTGLMCIQRCGDAINQCRQRAGQQHNQCLARARQQAVVEMPGRLAAYEKNIVAWEAAIRRYERDLSFYELRRRRFRVVRPVHCHDRDKDKRGCRPHRVYYPHRSFWADRPYYPGDAPRRPTLETVQAEIAAKTCGNAALQQCQASYRQCYSSCGGTVRQR